MDSEPINVGISRSAHAKLQRMKEDGHFNEMLDGYRFAIALALAHGGMITEFDDHKNMFGVGSLDPDRSLYNAIAALRRSTSEPVYRTAEKLATWGVEELDRISQQRTLSFADILEEAESLIGAGLITESQPEHL